MLSVIVSRIRRHINKSDGNESFRATCHADGRVVWVTVNAEWLAAKGVDVASIPAADVDEGLKLAKPLECESAGVVRPKMVVLVGEDNQPVYRDNGQAMEVQACYVPDGQPTRADGKANWVAVWELSAGLQ